MPPHATDRNTLEFKSSRVRTFIVATVITNSHARNSVMRATDYDRKRTVTNYVSRISTS